MNRKIKSWYHKTYPTDELYTEINNTYTFGDLLSHFISSSNEHLSSAINDCTAGGDTVIRERLFNKLENMTIFDYDFFYNKWLKA